MDTPLSEIGTFLDSPPKNASVRVARRVHSTITSLPLTKIASSSTKESGWNSRGFWKNSANRLADFTVGRSPKLYRRTHREYRARERQLAFTKGPNFQQMTRNLRRTSQFSGCGTASVRSRKSLHRYRLCGTSRANCWRLLTPPAVSARRQAVSGPEGCGE